MVNNIIEEITKQLKNEYQYVANSMIDNCFISLLILKYYCDIENKYLYQELINQEEITEVEYPIDDLKITISKIKYTKLLPLIEYNDLKEVTIEYLNRRNIEIDYFNNLENKLCITTKLNKDIYDITGNTTYIIDEFNIKDNDIATFKFFDKILKNNNKYITLKESLEYDYEYLFIEDNIPKYRFIKNSDNNIYKLITNLLNQKTTIKIILHTTFKKVSNLKDARFLLKYLSKVVLYEEQTYLYFENKTNNQVSIINYNKEKIKDYNHLKQIINNDRKQKDILVKTTTDNIKKNYFRIGFKLYQSKEIDSVRTINEIVDENTKLIEDLSYINTKIEEEINKLINK